MSKYIAKQSIGPYSSGDTIALITADELAKAQKAGTYKTGLTEKRAKELLEAGAIELLEGDGDDAPTDYSKMTVAELKEAAEAQGKEYDANARKDDLIKLLEG